MTALYLDCPKCGETDGVEVHANVEKVHVFAVDDVQALRCNECGTDPDDEWEYIELKRRVLAQLLETYDDGS